MKLVSALAAAALGALVAAPAAFAHVVPTPNFVESGTTASVSFASPNERDKPMTAFDVTVPNDLEIVHAHGPDAWAATVDGLTARWTGGSLAPGAQATFGLELRASGSPGNVSLGAEQRYADGVVRWPITLTITPAAKTPSQNFALAGVVGIVGLLVIGAIGALAWRRRADAADAG